MISCRIEWSIPGSSYQAHTSYNEFHHETTIVAFRSHRVNVMIELHTPIASFNLHAHKCTYKQAHECTHAHTHTHAHTYADTVNIYPFYLFGVISFLGFGLAEGSSRILA